MNMPPQSTGRLFLKLGCALPRADVVARLEQNHSLTFSARSSDYLGEYELHELNGRRVKVLSNVTPPDEDSTLEPDWPGLPTIIHVTAKTGDPLMHALLREPDLQTLSGPKPLG